MTYEIAVADPAKNITILVLTPVENREEAARQLLAEASLKAEQVGFVMPPRSPQGLWRLEMMGGEFCGNAARSFGLFVARKTGLSGKAEVIIEISGMKEPLSARVHVEEGTAEVRIPKPLSKDILYFQGQPAPIYCFNGIVHVIAPDIPPDKKNFFAIKRLIEQKNYPPQALGVMFYDQAKGFMIPGVYVYATDSLIFESSCGSGSAALGIWLHENLYEGTAYANIAQPGGTIEVAVTKRNGGVCTVSIGGAVALGKPYTLSI
jgi:diaminopimelate epimerase